MRRADLICDAAIQRGRLKHSWLENQVLNKSADKIIQLRREGPWEALENRFPIRVQEAIGLAGRIVDDYSPVVLIDRIPLFGHLDEDARARIKIGVHNAYLARETLTSRVEPLTAAARSLGVALEHVLQQWRRGSDCDIERTWQDVLRAASRLRDELDALPRTIVLP